ncbi:unnamed protein product [Pleuronectes platessa]|uniref:Uncharacterized protein n=1 Tax=Pleuronectes platessa TaxID=8262 RepID=A0A9N7Z461_PLEPL|nr:unnamed protein product [Pleuronectes platessa]
MGCTTSVVLLEGLRSILERNCGYIKGAAELGALEEEEETLSLRGSQLWNPTTALLMLLYRPEASALTSADPGTSRLLYQI